MYTIAVLSQKGGAGKTTLAVHLAVEAERSGLAAVIVDLDPQASATGWGDSRRQEAPAVVSAQASRLRQVLDCRPAERSTSSPSLTRLRIRNRPHWPPPANADLILIPCRPAILDLRAISHTVDLARIAAKPAAIVLNAVPPRGALGDEAVQAVEVYGVDVAPVPILAAGRFRALHDGRAWAQEFEPDGKAASEIRHALRWTM